jgi:hypothetical protein
VSGPYTHWFDIVIYVLLAVAVVLWLLMLGADK